MGRLFYSLAFLLACLSIQTTGYSQSFSLVRDINLGQEYDPIRPADLTEAGGTLYFKIKSGTKAGIWKTDGTEAGTVRLTELLATETIETLVELNNKLFFSVYNSSTNETAIWKSDGTAAGTIPFQYFLSRRTNSTLAIGGNLFVVFTIGSSFDLWKLDGTVGGVIPLKSSATAISNLTDINGTLFFTAAESSVPYLRLWKSDGTIAGTVVVKDISAGAGNPSFVSLFNANGTLFFAANDRVNGVELWKSDGTETGTVMIKDLEPGAGGSFISSFELLNNDVYFFATTTANGSSLWKSDGTGTGTVPVTPVSLNQNLLVNVNGTLFFPGNDAANGAELWKSDGTATGTVVVKDIRPGINGSFPSTLTNVNGVLYFSAFGLNEIWKSDGTEAGTVLLKAGFKGLLYTPEIFKFVRANGLTYFSPYELKYGCELWKTDGTPNGTALVKNILPSTDGSPQKFVASNGVAYFSVLNHVNSPGPVLGRDIFRTDGTFSGTARAENINGRYHSEPLDMATHNGELFISGSSSHNNNFNGWELYKIGASGVNEMVKNINPDNNGLGSRPEHFRSAGQFLYFSANDGTTGKELWKSDGTNAGTVMVKDINPSGNSNPDNLVNVNGTLYFTADNGTDGIELWKSDGTDAGTVMVKNIHTIGNSNPLLLVNVNGTLFFTADDGINGIELWKSNGTQTGTFMVKNINTSFSSNPASLTDINGILYFSADDGVNGVEVWKSNGTDAGTVLVKDIYSGPNGSNPALFTNLNGIAMFAANDGASGRELWGTDGTTTGTILIKDIQPGAAGSNPTVLTRVGGNILFAADDGLRGNEVWLTNGVEAGTRLMSEIQPGPAGSNPTEIFEFGPRILVAASSELFGSEVWISDVPAAGSLPLELLEFKGSVVNDDGVLRWKTNNELNTSSFILERSLDGRHYASIGSVSAANSPGVHYYDFTDLNIVSLGASNIYYRLKQTDIDGRYTYSNIVVLSMDHEKSIVMLYPNPTKDRINMTITISQSEKLQWQLTDNTGRAIKKGIYNLSAGSTALSIDVTNLASGTYLLQLHGTTLQKVFKVVKQ